MSSLEDDILENKKVEEKEILELVRKYPNRFRDMEELKRMIEEGITPDTKDPYE